jgi:hypothetical protein
MAVKRYNGTSWVVEAGSQGITYSATAPTAPAQGDIWVSTTDINTFDSLVQTGNRNVIINGTGKVTQRGANSSISSPNTYYNGGPDRWQVSLSALTGATFTGNVTSPGSNPPNATCMSLGGTLGGTGNSLTFRQRIEAANSAHLAGSTVTVSFWVYQTALASTLTNYITLNYATAQDNFASVTAIGSSSTVSVSQNTWQKITATFTIPSAATTGLELLLIFGGSSGTGSGTYYLTNIQLEAGSVATPFETRPYGQELALCQRYYVSETCQINGYTDQAGTPSTTRYYSVWLPATMRTAPLSANISGTTAAGAATVYGTPTARQISFSRVVGTTSLGTDLTSYNASAEL